MIFWVKFTVYLRLSHEKKGDEKISTQVPKGGNLGDDGTNPENGNSFLFARKLKVARV